MNTSEAWLTTFWNPKVRPPRPRPQLPPRLRLRPSPKQSRSLRSPLRRRRVPSLRKQLRRESPPGRFTRLNESRRRLWRAPMEPEWRRFELRCISTGRGLSDPPGTRNILENPFPAGTGSSAHVTNLIVGNVKVFSKFMIVSLAWFRKESD